MPNCEGGSGRRPGPEVGRARRSDGRVARAQTRGGKIYTIRYDRRGRCVYASGSDRYEERVLKFNPAGRTTWVTNSHGQVTTYEYNVRGQVVKTTSPTGEVGWERRRHYDTAHRLIVAGACDALRVRRRAQPHEARPERRAQRGGGRDRRRR